MVNQMEILEVIKTHPCLTNIEIAELLGAKVLNVNGKLCALERYGIIERTAEVPATWKIVDSDADTLPKKKVKRQTTHITVDGVSKTVCQWAHDLDTSPYTITMRIRRGWSERDAVTTPVKHTHDWTVELKTCPWCGKTPNIEHRSEKYELHHYCKVIDTEFCLSSKTRNEAVERWNNRIK